MIFLILYFIMRIKFTHYLHHSDRKIFSNSSLLYISLSCSLSQNYNYFIRSNRQSGQLKYYRIKQLKSTIEEELYHSVTQYQLCAFWILYTYYVCRMQTGRSICCNQHPKKTMTQIHSYVHRKVHCILGHTRSLQRFYMQQLSQASSL